MKFGTILTREAIYKYMYLSHNAFFTLMFGYQMKSFNTGHYIHVPTPILLKLKFTFTNRSITSLSGYQPETVDVELRYVIRPHVVKAGTQLRDMLTLRQFKQSNTVVDDRVNGIERPLRVTNGEQRQQGKCCQS